MLRPPSTIRLPVLSSEQLLQLKRRTGIPNWNTLCRWALALSLANEAPLSEHPHSGPSGLEIEWATLAGEYAQLYWALTCFRAAQGGRHLSEQSVQAQLRLHIVRGIGDLNRCRVIKDVLALSLT